MTLEEAKILADQGNLDAIIALGKYYFGNDANDDDRDIHEAIKWYEKGAEFGYPNCMYLASLLLGMNGHVIRKLAGGSDASNSLDSLNKAMFWAQKAYESGFKDADKQIISIKGEIGMSYYYYALGSKYSKPTTQESVERYAESIKLLKSVYKQTEDPEVYIFLALALNEYGELTRYTEENNRLEFDLYHKCVDEYFGEVVHSDIAACYLGVMYMDGRGCKVDYDKAVFYLKKAHNSGFDCSELLCHFKKKLFGGYTLTK